MKNISFIIPAHPDTYPSRVIQAISELKYPQERIEVIIVRGNSPSLQRNQAAKKATGELLYFLDDDSYINPEALINSVSYFDRPEIVAVGGPALTCSDASWLEHAFGAAIASWFGTGPTRARSRAMGSAREVRGEELILCNLLIRRNVLLDCAGFDVRLYPNEENELLKRLRRNGHRFIYLPEMIVKRPRRKVLKEFIRQMLFYGWGRSRHIFQSFEPLDILFLIPPIFIAYLILLPILTLKLPYALIPLSLYATLALVAAVRAAIRQKQVNLIFSLLVLFPIMHISYGLGLIAGLMGYGKSGRNVSELVFTKVIKPLSASNESIAIGSR